MTTEQTSELTKYPRIRNIDMEKEGVVCIPLTIYHNLKLSGLSTEQILSFELIKSKLSVNDILTWVAINDLFAISSITSLANDTGRVPTEKNVASSSLVDQIMFVENNTKHTRADFEAITKPFSIGQANINNYYSAYMFQRKLNTVDMPSLFVKTQQGLLVLIPPGFGNYLKGDVKTNSSFVKEFIKAAHGLLSINAVTKLPLFAIYVESLQ